MMLNIRNLVAKVFCRDGMPGEVRKIMDKVHHASFPGGVSQIKEEAEMLHVMLNGRVPTASLEKILAATKPMFLTRNCNNTGHLEMIDDFLFQQRVPEGISQQDIESIHEFYLSYFGMMNSPRAPTGTDMNPVDDLVLLHDDEGNLWASIRFQGRSYENPKDQLTKDGPAGIYQGILFPATAAARQNLSAEEKNDFSRMSGLPEIRWTDAHYRRFAFGFANWVTDPTTDDCGSPEIAKIKSWSNGYRVDIFGIVHGDQVFELYRKTLVNLRT